ncbi:hypothetical protein [Candidatus Uabimicrobium sp. HlEnr_7]|uniref:hypothetical protein n=1 Tax=Candidatus Uabimicrobium helgolandensis TaxID=3095367 RepID=UPI003556ED88
MDYLEDIETALILVKQRASSFGSFAYDFCDQHFSAVARQNLKEYCDSYGVYIIRQATTLKIIYIGKAGTVKNDGTFKQQGLFKRLTNERSQKTPANIWFKGLLDKYGSLQIDYFILEKSFCPAFAEAILLQTYLNENGFLPEKNEAL